MKEISQRELRNDNAAVIRGVEAGESYVVTKRGVPVAVLSPMPRNAGLKRVRAASDSRPFSERARVRASRPVSEVLEDLRGDR